MLSKYASILWKYKSSLSTNILSKYTSILSKYKGILSNHKSILSSTKVYFQITQVYLQSTKVYSGSTKVYSGSTEIYCGEKNPKARLLRVLFNSIDLLALFGVYAGIIITITHMIMIIIVIMLVLFGIFQQSMNPIHLNELPFFSLLKEEGFQPQPLVSMPGPSMRPHAKSRCIDCALTSRGSRVRIDALIVLWDFEIMFFLNYLIQKLSCTFNSLIGWTYTTLHMGSGWVTL